MRPSPFRHPLAVLRMMLQLSQEEFGKEIVSEERPHGLSRRTIQAIELRKLPLTPENALRINRHTGVSVDWLLAGDPDTPPYYVDELEHKVAYTKEVYDQIKAGKESEYEIVFPEDTPAKLHVRAIATSLDWFPIFCAASKAGKSDLAAYYLHKFLAEIRERFGYDLETASQISGHAKLVEGDGSVLEFVYNDDHPPCGLTQIKGKSGIKIRRKPKAESPKKL